MGAPLVPRKKKKKAPPNPLRCGENNPLWRAWHDPARRAHMQAHVEAAAKKAGRPPMVADGSTKKQTDRLYKKAVVKANRIIKVMEDEGLIDPVEVAAGVTADGLVDDDKAAARAALKEAIVMTLMPGDARNRLAAARTVLEWTRAKPAATVNNNLGGAEEFLAGLLAKDSK